MDGTLDTVFCHSAHFFMFKLSSGREMSLSDERLKRFAEKCAELGKSLGVDVVDLYTLFHTQPVRLQHFQTEMKCAVAGHIHTTRHGKSLQ